MSARAGGVLEGKMKLADAEQLLNQPNVDYAVLVTGKDLGALEKLGESALKSRTYLAVKGSKKIAASSIEFQRNGAATKVSAILFRFPRRGANGGVCVPPGEKSMEFVCAPPSLSVRVSFDLRKMTDKQGLDL